VVSDPSGAVVTGATVLVERADTGTHRQTLTDTEGRYEVVVLVAGEYRIVQRVTF
jgi:Carboxypeptidase regulatory-like domain